MSNQTSVFHFSNTAPARVLQSTPIKFDDLNFPPGLSRVQKTILKYWTGDQFQGSDAFVALVKLSFVAIIGLYLCDDYGRRSQQETRDWLEIFLLQELALFRQLLKVGLKSPADAYDEIAKYRFFGRKVRCRLIDKIREEYSRVETDEFRIARRLPAETFTSDIPLNRITAREWLASCDGQERIYLHQEYVRMVTAIANADGDSEGSMTRAIAKYEKCSLRQARRFKQRLRVIWSSVQDDSMRWISVNMAALTKPAEY